MIRSTVCCSVWASEPLCTPAGLGARAVRGSRCTSLASMGCTDSSQHRTTNSCRPRAWHCPQGWGLCVLPGGSWMGGTARHRAAAGSRGCAGRRQPGQRSLASSSADGRSEESAAAGSLRQFTAGLTGDTATEVFPWRLTQASLLTSATQNTTWPCAGSCCCHALPAAWSGWGCFGAQSTRGPQGRQTAELLLGSTVTHCCPEPTAGPTALRRG